MELSDHDLLIKIFWPEEPERTTTEFASKKFVHYTSAAAGMSILKNDGFWMRSVRGMNDTSEIEFGTKYALAMYGGTRAARINQLLPSLRLLDPKDVNPHWLDEIKRTEILCLSEHDRSEDQSGRLSMWRGYGAESSVAFIVNSDAFNPDTDQTRVYSTPVAYPKEGRLEEDFERRVSLIEQHQERLHGMDPERVQRVFYECFGAWAVGTKHPGFLEEKEWRVFTHPRYGESPIIEKSVELINGSPQRISKLVIGNHEEHGVRGTDWETLVHKLMIGPCADADLVREAFVCLLDDKGVSNAEARVVVSDIPYRG